MKIEDRLSIVRELFKVAYAAMDYEERVRRYGTDVTITGGEIYLMKLIAENPGGHITRLGEMAGVSKAAASQMVQRLEKKGLVKKVPGEDNRSRFEISLTAKGLSAHKEHLAIESRLAHLVAEGLDGLSEAEGEKMKKFFERVQRTLASE